MSECAKCGLMIGGYPEEEYCLCGYKGRISELEGQLAYEQERNQLNVAQHTDGIKELEAILADPCAKVELLPNGDYMISGYLSRKKVEELEAELATLRTYCARKHLELMKAEVAQLKSINNSNLKR